MTSAPDGRLRKISWKDNRRSARVPRSVKPLRARWNSVGRGNSVWTEFLALAGRSHPSIGGT